MNGPRLPNAPRPVIPKAVAAAIMARDGDRCVYCGVTIDLTLDHVYPFIQGGSSDPTNLVVACQTCNRLASDRVWPELVAKHDWIVWARTKLTPTELAAIRSG